MTASLGLGGHVNQSAKRLKFDLHVGESAQQRPDINTRLELALTCRVVYNDDIVSRLSIQNVAALVDELAMCSQWHSTVGDDVRAVMRRYVVELGAPRVRAPASAHPGARAEMNEEPDAN